LSVQLPNRSVVFCACKILTGLVAALLSFLSGQTTCAPNVFGICYGTYLPFELMQFSITLLAVSILVSALKDVFVDLGRITLLERDIESVVAPVAENPILGISLYDA